MACCAVRCILLAVCIVQMVATIQRQILDFLGYMWTPIIVNFLQIIVVIVGIFGAYQYKIKYITCYAVWNSLWLGWNIFVICVYMETGLLTRDTEVLNLGTGSRSWWLANGVGCDPVYNGTHEDPLLFPTPSSVEGCLLEYFYVEAIQAFLQCLLAVVGVVSACGTIYVITRDDDSCSAKRAPPYSIEFHNNVAAPHPDAPQRPMTPRKVKQRSTRRSRRGGSGRRRPTYQNPVTKLINSQNNAQNCYGPGRVNPSFEPGPDVGSLPNSILFLDGRPGHHIYANEMDTVI